MRKWISVSPGGSDQFSTHARWPDADSGPYLISLSWADVQGQLECVGLEIRSAPRPPDAGGEPVAARQSLGSHRLRPVVDDRDGFPRRMTITTTLIRGLRIAELIQEARQAAIGVSVRESYRHRAEAAIAERTQRWLGEQHKARGRRGYGARHFEQVALIYTEALGDGRPTSTVAERFKVTKSAAAKWVARARRMGLLETTRRGRTH